MGKSKIRKLKKKLHKTIDDHGRDSPRVLEVSQQLDKYIVKDMQMHKNTVRN